MGILSKILYLLSPFLTQITQNPMSTNYARKALALIVSVFIFTLAFSQSRYDGDMLMNALGKADQSQELSDLKAGYSFQMANENHYLSKEGIELVLQNAALSEIRIYMNSVVYGGFKGKLPKGLRFGITSAEVKHELGKPSVSYSSGYCEFEQPGGLIISCWFDKDRLSQVDLGLK
jgi:hypothetical protein